MPRQIALTLDSQVDGLSLAALLVEPEGAPCGVVQFSHGMAEHKERYLPMMLALAEHGLVCMIHDHRGHGGSVRQAPEDLGYFYDDTGKAVVDDLYQVTQHLKNRFPGLPLTLFAHSMGTLVARVYLQAHDDAIDRLVLCGAPCANGAAGFGIALAGLIGKFKGDHYRSRLIQGIVFGSCAHYFPDAASPNAWLCANPDAVRAYEADPLCGFTFTCNGFSSLFHLVKQSFCRKDWQMKQPALPIHFIAGDCDPIIGGVRAWQASQRFLYERGYTHVSSKLYHGLRHELINEKQASSIIRDVAIFILSDR